MLVNQAYMMVIVDWYDALCDWDSGGAALKKHRVEAFDEYCGIKTLEYSNLVTPIDEHQFVFCVVDVKKFLNMVMRWGLKYSTLPDV